MKFRVTSGDLRGTAQIPGSKSNTTRAVVFATLADGVSVIENPVHSVDCYSTCEVCRGFGAEIEIAQDRWTVRGVGRNLQAPNDVLNVGNSGTTLYIITATAALVDKGYSVISGDYQIRYRPSGSLLAALNDLGATAFSTRDNGCAPIVVKGLMKGGKTSLPGVNSQWLTPLLINAPLASGDTEVIVDNLQERPYIAMTLGWLDRRGVKYEMEEMRRFKVFGGQTWGPFHEVIPADWESACFPLVAAAITNSDVTVHGMDTRDYQGDKAIVDILQAMGADVVVRNHGLDGIRVRGGRELHGIEIDCRDLPDAPPILAVLGTQARGRTVLYNLGASKLKETDRSRVIARELRKMGARITEEADRVIIEPSSLHGAEINGNHDHRIIMATACAALVADGPTVIDTAEYYKISFPTFYEVMTGLGARIEWLPEIR
ncbi:MAG: 3-phosphoshikimate 1-carboxyvinyltransferase [Firmicutes bacterium]|nr:3-phosphoshikimate 1-carboxyvinyltransferase [Bacillota bacterium]